MKRNSFAFVQRNLICITFYASNSFRFLFLFCTFSPYHFRFNGNRKHAERNSSDDNKENKNENKINDSRLDLLEHENTFSNSFLSLQPQTDNWATKDIHKLTIAFNGFRFPFPFHFIFCALGVCLSVSLCMCGICLRHCNNVWFYMVIYNFCIRPNDERKKKLVRLSYIPPLLTTICVLCGTASKSSLFECQHKTLLWLLYIGFLNRFEQRQLASILFSGTTRIKIFGISEFSIPFNNKLDVLRTL